jgi:hypothetical protein
MNAILYKQLLKATSQSNFSKQLLKVTSQSNFSKQLKASSQSEFSKRVLVLKFWKRVLENNTLCTRRIKVQVNAFGQEHNLELTLNSHILPEYAKIVVVQSDTVSNEINHYTVG